MTDLLDNPVWLILLAIAAVAGRLAWWAYLYRIRNGAFNRAGNPRMLLVISTSIGKFSFDKAGQELKMTLNDQPRTIPFQSITGLEFRLEESSANALEFLTGWSIWDFGKYRDRFLWCHVNLVTDDGVEVPIFVAGQYEKREAFLEGLGVLAVRALLGFMGSYEDVHEYSRKIYHRIKADLQDLSILP